MDRRIFLRSAALAATYTLRARASSVREFNVLSFGAKGDGLQNDTRAMQRALDTAAAGGGGRVVVPGKRRFLTGGLQMRSRVEFHLAEDAVLLASTTADDYANLPGVINSSGAAGFSITGTGLIDGQALSFMEAFSDTDQRWEPKAFRPRMFSLHTSSDFQIGAITFANAPYWGLHMLGCEHVLVDGLHVRNRMDVPNCDGIDPDHCRDVEIANCKITGADDSIVIKTSEFGQGLGPSRNIYVHDCVLKSRDSGLKIGTENYDDISNIVFERCQIVASGRGPTITHRQKGNIENVEFRDIDIEAEHHAPRWWGWGEAASVTAWPRTADGHVGRVRDIRFKRLRARAENSFRIDGQPKQPIEDVLLEDVSVTIGRWTDWPGEAFDNRPVAPGIPGLETHDTPAFSLRHINGLTLRHCSAQWNDPHQSYWSNALQMRDVHQSRIEGFSGQAAHPAQQAIVE